MQHAILSFSKAAIKQGGNTVLKDIDLVVHPGDFVFLIGKTGSGKSSLIKTLYGDLNLESGQGQIVGYNLNKLKEKQSTCHKCLKAGINACASSVLFKIC